MDTYAFAGKQIKYPRSLLHHFPRYRAFDRVSSIFNFCRLYLNVRQASRVATAFRKVLERNVLGRGKTSLIFFYHQ